MVLKVFLFLSEGENGEKSRKMEKFVEKKYLFIRFWFAAVWQSMGQNNNLCFFKAADESKNR